MNDPPAKQSVNIFEQISLICKEFRRAYKAGQGPRIEDWLERVGADAQSTLFSNLLQIEVLIREKGSERPGAQEYLKRFPQFANQVRQAFDESTMGSMEFESGTPGNAAADNVTRTFEIPAANRLGDYELIRELGRGGFGVVYEARHLKRNNVVALKTLPAGVDGQKLNADRLHKFRREFRSLSQINHPNLVGMQTLEVDGDQWFFTMDLIDGEDFLSYVRPGDQLDRQRLRPAIKQLARGVIALHELDIIHRDLKPSNVLVESDGRVMILDFGLVAELRKQTDLTVSRSGMFAGTPRYAAPEQMFGERSEASDWYAFGAILYEALSGQPPFSGKLMELMRQKQNGDPPPLAGRVALPKEQQDLAALADGLLRRDPTQRMMTGEIIEALQLDLETKTRGSQGSSASVGEDENDLLLTQDDVAAEGFDWSKFLDVPARKKVRGLGRKARLLFYANPNLQPHIQRARGRAFCALGRKKKAIRCFEHSVKLARKKEMDYDLARSLLDLAAVKEEGRDKIRSEGIELLKKMESVIPRAGSWLLGEQYDEAVVAPEFDLAEWERENGNVSPIVEGTA